jgi:hypothetical protein
VNKGRGSMLWTRFSAIFTKSLAKKMAFFLTTYVMITIFGDFHQISGEKTAFFLTTYINVYFGIYFEKSGIFWAIWVFYVSKNGNTYLAFLKS